MIRLLDNKLLITFSLSLVTSLPVAKESSRHRRHDEMWFYGWTEQTDHPLWDSSDGATRGQFGFAEIQRQIPEDVAATRRPTSDI